jgi:hypothetical protein
LRALLKAARTSLPWLDWEALRDGVRRRNEIAHEGALFGSDVCLADIMQIERQLAAWKVIDAP